MVGHRISATAFILLGMTAVYLASKLPYYTPNGPGPGFYPIWLGGILGLIASIHLVRLVLADSRAASEQRESVPAQEQDEAGDPHWPDRSGAVRVALVLASIIYVSIVIEWIGFQLSILTMMIVVLTALGRQRVIVTASVSTIGSFGVYFAFTQWLGIQLPTAQFAWLSGLGL